jgi:hypothetical protein
MFLYKQFNINMEVNKNLLFGQIVAKISHGTLWIKTNCEKLCYVKKSHTENHLLYTSWEKLPLMATAFSPRHVAIAQDFNQLYYNQLQLKCSQLQQHLFLLLVEEIIHRFVF